MIELLAGIVIGFFIGIAVFIYSIYRLKVNQIKWMEKLNCCPQCGCGAVEILSKKLYCPDCNEEFKI